MYEKHVCTIYKSKKCLWYLHTTIRWALKLKIIAPVLWIPRHWYSPASNGWTLSMYKIPLFKTEFAGKDELSPRTQFTYKRSLGANKNNN